MSFPDDPAEPAVAAHPPSEPILETAESAEVATDAAGDAAPPPRRSGYASDRSFADFPISSEVLLGVQALGYEMATPVQALTIDAAIAGKDLLVRAKTGTGKTAAFCVPMVERCPAGARRVSGIVLTPTRELAVQVAQECAGIAKYKDLTIVAIYGGVGFGPQEEALKAGAEIVVGTPGRVLDHLRRGNLDLSDLKVAVLDEADEMLSMGFLEDVKKILSKAPKDRQNLLFSATVDETIKGLIASYLNNPEEIFLSFDGDNVSTITHILYETSPDYHKARALLDLIEQERPNAAIVFCNTREDVSTVYTYLDRQGLGVEMLSGELPQKQRERVMARIKSGAVQFLVSTDVAARGIDITDLTHVINYSLPDDAAIYLHRCGRTGRIGKSGVAITLAGGADFSTRITLTRTHKIDFQIKTLPTAEESGRLRTERFVRIIKDAAGSTAYEGYLDLVRAIKERPDGDMLLAVAIRGLLSWDRARKNAAADDTGGAAEAEARSEDRPRDAPRDRDGRGGRDGGRRDERGRDARPNDRPRDDRPRDDRPRDARPGDRGPDRGPRRDDRPRDDRPRQGDRPRDDRPRHSDRPSGNRPGGDRPRDDRPRAGSNDAPRERGDQRPPEGAARAENDVAPRAVSPEAAESDEDTADGPTNPGAAGEGADGAARKKRRRRRRRSGGEGTGPTGGGASEAAAAPPTAAE